MIGWEVIAIQSGQLFKVVDFAQEWSWNWKVLLHWGFSVEFIFCCAVDWLSIPYRSFSLFFLQPYLSTVFALKGVTAIIHAKLEALACVTKTQYNSTLEYTARYAGLLLAPAEGFVHRPRLFFCPSGKKKTLLCCFTHFWSFLVSSSNLGNF